MKNILIGIAFVTMMICSCGITNESGDIQFACVFGAIISAVVLLIIAKGGSYERKN